MSDRFKQFVQEQKKQTEAEAAASALTLEQEKQRWLSNLQKLDELVREWLIEYTTGGDVKIQTESITLNEEQIGAYKAPLINILISSKSVKLKPIGTFLIGAYGRVDMEGSRGVSRLVIVPASANGPKLGFASTPSSSTQPLELAWKIATPPPTMKYINLSKETFLDEMMRVIQGA